MNVSDGEWHTVSVERKKRLGLIHVDDEKPVRVTADPGATILNSNGKLWIGTTARLFQQYFCPKITNWIVLGLPNELLFF